MKVKIDKEDLIKCWNEAEETVTSFNELSDEDLILCKQALLNRVEIIRDLLGCYIGDNDIIKN